MCRPRESVTLGGSHGTLAGREGEEHMDAEKRQQCWLKKKKKKSEGRVKAFYQFLLEVSINLINTTLE